jgi:hypothetical protein
MSAHLTHGKTPEQDRLRLRHRVHAARAVWRAGTRSSAAAHMPEAAPAQGAVTLRRALGRTECDATGQAARAGCGGGTWTGVVRAARTQSAPDPLSRTSHAK